MPTKFSSLFKRMLWSIVSNAALRSSRTNAQRSVASAWREKRKQVVSGVRGVCDDVTCPFLHSGVVQVLKAGQVDTNNPFCCPNSPLQSSYIWFAGWPKPDSYRGAQNRLNNSRVKLCHMRLWQVELFQFWRRKNNLCWAFFMMESMWVSHFRSWEMVVPRNLNDSTAVTVLFMMVSRGSAGGFLLKSTIISTVLSMFSSRLLWLH